MSNALIKLSLQQGRPMDKETILTLYTTMQYWSKIPTKYHTWPAG